MTYKHIIFDIDGTLLDTEKAVLCSLQETIQTTQHRRIEIEDLTFALGIPGEVTLQKLGVKNPQQANKLWNNLLADYFHTIKLFDGITDTLKELKQAGCKMGIISSKNQAEFNNDFAPFNATAYFDTIILVTDSPRPKPSPDPMLEYLKRTGISAHEAIYIGDTIYDMQCAKASKVDFGLAVWGCRSKDPIDAEYYFNTPLEVLSLIE